MRQADTQTELNDSNLHFVNSFIFVFFSSDMRQVYSFQNFYLYL